VGSQGDALSRHTRQQSLPDALALDAASSRRRDRNGQL
ncbi:MAG: hypothetical protein AVDCRST_MAG80-1336, partial [uncultured Rubrobacteraceae bacterium]